MAEFLRANAYPHDWDATTLAGYCLVAGVEEGPRVVGYVWFNWVDGADRVLEVHACVAEDVKKRWLTRRVLADLHKIAELVGARSALIKPPTPEIARGLEKIGFHVVGPFAIKKIE